MSLLRNDHSECRCVLGGRHHSLVLPVVALLEQVLIHDLLQLFEALLVDLVHLDVQLVLVHILQRLLSQILHLLHQLREAFIGQAPHFLRELNLFLKWHLLFTVIFLLFLSSLGTILRGSLLLPLVFGHARVLLELDDGFAGELLHVAREVVDVRAGDVVGLAVLPDQQDVRKEVLILLVFLLRQVFLQGRLVGFGEWG